MDHQIRWFAALFASLSLILSSISAQDIVISEFMAKNANSLDDEDGDSSDWIELYNVSENAVDLDGWFLTDNALQLNKWPFPSVVLQPNAYLLVFASSKDRRDPAGELHTNFKLSGGGEYLGLVQADGTTVEHEYAPSYPGQIDDLSYGLGQSGSAGTTVLIDTGAAVKYKVPNNDDDDVENGLNPDSFIGLSFDDSSWTSANTGLGYATGSPDAFDSEISGNGDLQSEMYLGNTSVYVRIPFTVTDPSVFGTVTLKMKYDDGFVAYLNGDADGMAESNAPGAGSLAWDSNATANHPDSSAIVFEDFQMPASSLPFQVGQNVLCIHGLNRSSTSSDFLLLPELEVEITGGGLNGEVNYFVDPTPGETNGDGLTDPGPIVTNVPKTVSRPVIGGGPDTVLVDSQTEFSGVQGQDGWYYGYYDRTADLAGSGNGTYDYLTEFTLFAGGTGQGVWNGTTQMWDGTEWRRNNVVSEPLTRLGGTNLHPNDAVPGPEEYPVRRWVSDLSGAYRLDGTFHNLDVSGDGTNGRIFINGIAIYSALSDGNAQNFTEEVILSVGDVIDFLVDVGPIPGGDTDGVDLTEQTVQILDGWASGALTNIPITASVSQSINPVALVELKYRVMFGAESTVTMVDDGTGGDLFASDGVYTGVIATNQLSDGEMLRWRVVATDNAANSTTHPSFHDPLDSPEYWGTVATNSAEDDSLLTILHWFCENTGEADTLTGTRSSAYYLGVFYDNILTDLHGQSSKQFPKKSYDFDFNKGNRFRWKEGEKKVKDLNLVTNWSDKSKVRQTLGYDIVDWAGGWSHYCFPVRVQRNGSFFSVADFIEDSDDRWLERMGLDEDGALYKMKNGVTSGTVDVEKKTRLWEDNTDLVDYVAGLALSGDARERFGIDNTNIPALVNYMATTAIFSHRDNGKKNFFLYRDSDGSQEWSIIEWDLDLSLGRRWIAGSVPQGHFNDGLYQDRAVNNATSLNRIHAFVAGSSVLTELLNRRVRTLLDEILGQPGTSSSLALDRIDELLALVDPPGVTSDADLDYAAWGSWGDNHNMAQAIDRLKHEHLHDTSAAVDRREYLDSLGSVPSSQPAAPTINIGTIDYNPTTSGATADQSGEYFVLENPNNYAVDISGWRIYGAVDFNLPAGSVIPSGSVANPGLVYLTRDAVGFRSRAVSPTANEKCIVITGYDGQLSSRGETIYLEDRNATQIDSLAYVGSPTTLQQYLRVTELHYHPADPTAGELAVDPTLSASDFEFVELTNIGPGQIDISNSVFTKGISFTFPATTLLDPGDYILIVAKQSAFEMRYGTGLNVVGEYTGQFSNDGEAVQLLDAVGESILSFTFNDVWYDPTDGIGYSLVLLDPVNTLFNDWDEEASWGISQNTGGSPDAPTTEISLVIDAFKNYNFTAAELLDPLVSGDGVDLDGDGASNLLEYILGLDPKQLDSDAFPTSGAVNESGSEYITITFRRQKNALDISYIVEKSADLVNWVPVNIIVGAPVDNGDGTETVTYRADDPLLVGAAEFIRLRYVVSQ